jgi:hypothetical protein
MCNSRSLDIFAALPGDLGLPDHPSWLPNWANCFPYGAPIATPVSKFNACRGIPYEFEHSVNQKELRVKGKVIDRIHLKYRNITAPNAVGCEMSYFLHWDMNLQSAMHALYRDEFRKALGDYFPVKLATMPRDVLRTILADGAMGSQQPLLGVHKYLEVINRSGEMRKLRETRSVLTDDQKRLVADYERLEDMAMIAKQKQLFFTEHLQLGLATDAAREGDLVAILHGSKTPVVLRETDKGSREYQAVCQCYLNGWMYGQSPREVYGTNSAINPHPHGRWWDEEPDEITLV